MLKSYLFETIRRGVADQPDQVLSSSETRLECDQIQAAARRQWQHDAIPLWHDQAPVWIRPDAIRVSCRGEHVLHWGHAEEAEAQKEDSGPHARMRKPRCQS